MKKTKLYLLIGLLMVGLIVISGCNKTSQDADKSGDDLAKKLAATYNLKPLSAEDANYTINMGYYNCDHMTAACIGMDAGIYEALGLKINLTGNGNVPEAMSAGKMDIIW